MRKKDSINEFTTEALVHKYQLWQDFMDQIPDVVYFKDKNGRLVMVNQAHAKGLGLKPEEVVGKTDFDIFPKQRAQAMQKDDLYVMRSGKAIIDKIERATRPDGIDNYVSTTKIPRYNDQGRIIGLIGITRDITHRMQVEQLREENLRIEKKLGALEEINKMKSDFVSVVSHELRTPLAIIQEAIKLVFDEAAGSLNQKQKGVLKKAIENAGRLNNIINDLLDISRIERGALKLHYSLVNLNDLLKESSDFFKKQAEHKGIILKYQLPEKEANIFIDAQRINQVIANLINNAVKFTERTGKIRVELKFLETKVRIAVIDTGIGIDKQHLNNLFNKFVQFSKIPDIESKGLGLGLAIAKELVERHQGEIWAESQLGVGSRFYFTLPRFYTADILDARTKKRANELLSKNTSVYLINLLIVNYKKFIKRIILKPKDFFIGLERVVELVFNKMYKSNWRRLGVVIADPRKGECGIIFPETSEEKAMKICALIKNNARGYCLKNKIKNIFINFGFISYHPAKEAAEAGQLMANLRVKKIYLGAEIRRFLRLAYHIDIDVVFRGSSSESAQLVDISRGGVCFIAKRPLQTDAKIDISLRPTEGKELIHAQARVAWIKKLEDRFLNRSPSYKVGLEFVALSKKDKHALSNLIAMLKKRAAA